MMSKPSPARLRIDRIACDGAGLCAALLPEMITLDEWGYPVVAGPSVPRALVRHARTAVTLCPRLALHLDAQRAEKPPSTNRAVPVT